MHPEIFHITPNNSLREILATVNSVADIPDCQRSAAERLIARTGLSAWESRGARSQWVVSFYTAGTHTKTHMHKAPVMEGRFQPAASERSALEFLRPKEISN